MTHPQHDNTLQQILARHAEDVLHRLNSSSEGHSDKSRRIYNVSIPHFAALLLHHKSEYLVIEDTPEHAEALCHDLQYFVSACERKELMFDYFPPSLSPELVGERARILRKLVSGGVSHIITSIDAVNTGFGKSAPFDISKGLSVDRELMEMMLAEIGYRKVNIVMEKGEYAERGWLFDIYPVTEELPVRVEFFGDEIDLIRTFDIETQRSIKKIKELKIYPAMEPLIEVVDGEIDNSLIRMMPKAPIFLSGKIAPEIISKNDLDDVTVFSHFAIAGEGIDSGAVPVAGLGILPEERQSINDVGQVLSKINKKVIIVLASTAQIERCRDILSERRIVAPVINTEQTCLYEGIFCLTKGTLSAGLHLPNLLILTAREIFGEQPA